MPSQPDKGQLGDQLDKVMHEERTKKMTLELENH